MAFGQINWKHYQSGIIQDEREFFNMNIATILFIICLIIYAILAAIGYIESDKIERLRIR
jgi:hypothetical protein